MNHATHYLQVLTNVVQWPALPPAVVPSDGPYIPVDGQCGCPSQCSKNNTYYVEIRTNVVHLTTFSVHSSMVRS